MLNDYKSLSKGTWIKRLPCSRKWIWHLNGLSVRRLSFVYRSKIEMSERLERQRFDIINQRTPIALLKKTMDSQTTPPRRKLRYPNKFKVYHSLTCDEWYYINEVRKYMDKFLNRHSLINIRTMKFVRTWYITFETWWSWFD